MQSEASRGMMTWGIPNRITLFRLAATVFLLLVFNLAPDQWKFPIFLLVTVLNVGIDVVDGNIARYLGQETVSGKFLDAAGDRLVKTFIMCVLSQMGVFPWLLTAFHLGVKNQFFELPAFYVEGYLKEKERVRRELPFYYALTYNRPWIGFGVVLNHFIWLILVFDYFSRPILSPAERMALYALFFLHSLVRAIPFISIYEYLDRGLVRPEGIVPVNHHN